MAKTTKEKGGEKVNSLTPYLQQFKNNKLAQRLTYGILAIIVVVGGWYAYKYFVVRPADEEAQMQLTTGIQMLTQASQVQQQAAYVESMPDSALTQALKQQGMIPDSLAADSVALVVKKFREEQKKGPADMLNKALKGEGKFPGFLRMAKGSGAGANIATYLAGKAYYMLGNYKEAIKFLEDFSPKGDEGVSPMALSLLANCYACDKQIDKAIDTFKDAASEADNENLSPILLVEAGKLLESKGDKAKAHELYVQIKNDYPAYGMTQNGMMSSTIDMFIERTAK